MKILGLDLGSKTCGFAIADSSKKIATGLLNYEYSKNDLMQVINKIKSINNDYNREIELIVLGYPKNLKSDNKNESSIRSEKLAQLISNNLNIKVAFQDENFTTSRATERLMEYNIKASSRKKVIDMISSIIILQDYLDNNR